MLSPNLSRVLSRSSTSFAPLALSAIAMACGFCRESQAARIQEQNQKAERSGEQRSGEQRSGEQGQVLISVRGRVLDKEGSPLAGLVVHLINSPQYGMFIRTPGPGDFEQYGTLAKLQDYGLAEFTTNEDGRFEFHDVVAPKPHFQSPPESWHATLVVAHPDSALSIHDLDYQSHDPEKPVEIKLAPGCSVSGRVVDTAGRPLAAIRVMANTAMPLGSDGEDRNGKTTFVLGNSSLVPQTMTGEDGTFNLGGLPENQIVVLGTASCEYLETNVFVATTNEPQPPRKTRRRVGGVPVEVEEPVHNQSAEIVLERGKWLTVTVRVQDGALESAGLETMPDLELSCWQSGSSFGRARKTVRNVETVRFGPWPGEPLVIMTRMPDKPPLIVRYQLVEFDADSEETTAEVVIEKPVAVRGKVVDDQGLPASGVQVMLVPAEQAYRLALQTYTAETGADGEFEVFAPGDCEGTLILARKNDDQRYQLPITEAANGPAQYNQSVAEDRQLRGPSSAVDTKNLGEPLRFTVRPTLMIRGRLVEADGTPVNDPVIKLTNEDQLAYHYGRTIRVSPPALENNGDGTFVFSGVEDRVVPIYSFSSPATGDSIIASLPIDGREDEFVVKLAASGSVQGRVLLDGQPLANHPVRLFPIAAGNYPPDGQVMSGEMYFSQNETEGITTRTNEKGEFEFTNIQSGMRYAMISGHESGDRMHCAFTGGKSLTPPEFAFFNLDATISGQVVDPKGNPVEGVSFRASLPRTDNSNPYIRTLPGPSAADQDNRGWRSGPDGMFTVEKLPRDRRITLHVSPFPDDRTRGLSFSVEVDSGVSGLRLVVDPGLVRQPPKRKPVVK